MLFPVGHTLTSRLDDTECLEESLGWLMKIILGIEVAHCRVVPFAFQVAGSSQIRISRAERTHHGQDMF